MDGRRLARFTRPWTWAGPHLSVRSPGPSKSKPTCGPPDSQPIIVRVESRGCSASPKLCRPGTPNRRRRSAKISIQKRSDTNAHRSRFVRAKPGQTKSLGKASTDLVDPQGKKPDVFSTTSSMPSRWGFCGLFTRTGGRLQNPQAHTRDRRISRSSWTSLPRWCETTSSCFECR
jgi:hypothetical protein